MAVLKFRKGENQNFESMKKKKEQHKLFATNNINFIDCIIIMDADGLISSFCILAFLGSWLSQDGHMDQM